MAFFGCRVLDSRGASRLVPQPDWKLGAIGGSGEQSARLARVRAELHGVPSGLGKRLTGGVLVGAALAFMLYRQAAAWLGPRDMAGAAVVSLLVGAAAGWGYFRIGVRPPDIAAASRAFVGCRLCVCCGYDLTGGTPQADGCVVCPECGAAWRLV